MKMGAFHTLELEINRKFTLEKPLWDLISLEATSLSRLNTSLFSNVCADSGAGVRSEKQGRCRGGDDGRRSPVFFSNALACVFAYGLGAQASPTSAWSPRR